MPDPPYKRMILRRIYAYVSMESLCTIIESEFFQ